MTKLIIRLTTFATVSLFLVGGAQAGTITTLYTGSLGNDDDLGHFVLTLGAALSDVTLTSLGYAGGVAGDTTVIADGGFDPIISVFDAAGTLIDFDDDSRGVAAASTGKMYDSLLTLTGLVAGDYWVFVSQYDNWYEGPGLPTDANSWAFPDPNFPKFTGNIGNNPCPGPFCDASGAQRTGDWAVDASVVPIPAALWLFGSALGLLGWLRRPGTGASLASS